MLVAVQIVLSSAIPAGIRRNTQLSLLNSEKIDKRSINEEVLLQNLNEGSKEENTKANVKIEEIKDTPEKEPEDVPEEIAVTFEVAEENINEDMDTAASAIVFRPLFVYRYQQIKRGRRTRSVYLPKTNEPKLSRTKRSTPPSSNNNREDNFMDTAESSTVFRPLFRYKQR